MQASTPKEDRKPPFDSPNAVPRGTSAGPLEGSGYPAPYGGGAGGASKEVSVPGGPHDDVNAARLAREQNAGEANGGAAVPGGSAASAAAEQAAAAGRRASTSAAAAVAAAAAAADANTQEEAEAAADRAAKAAASAAAGAAGAARAAKEAGKAAAAEQAAMDTVAPAAGSEIEAVDGGGWDGSTATPGKHRR